MTRQFIGRARHSEQNTHDRKHLTSGRIAVYRDGTWYLLQSTDGFSAIQWGVATDIPAPADYDGDGKTDIAVFRDGIWNLLKSTGGFSAVHFGLIGDKPIPFAFLP